MAIPDWNRLAQAAKELGYRSLRRYQARANFVFNKVSLTGAHVLDVGCGQGAFSLWAALQGAEYVLGIEPESHGSSQGALQTFLRLINDLSLSRSVEASNLTLQELSGESKFDVVILYDVVNHLDENAVQHLHEDSRAFEKYLSIAHHLRSLLRPGGLLILGDCDRTNFWHTIGAGFPMIQTIEWQKHQSPKIWISVFTQSGFRLDDLRWSPLYPFGWFSSNHLVQYLTISHFVSRFRAV